jgi:hypothetical protein
MLTRASLSIQILWQPRSNRVIMRPLSTLSIVRFLIIDHNSIANSIAPMRFYICVVIQFLPSLFVNVVCINGLVSCMDCCRLQASARVLCRCISSPTRMLLAHPRRLFYALSSKLFANAVGSVLYACEALVEGVSDICDKYFNEYLQHMQY